jgi:hypothetical protein
MIVGAVSGFWSGAGIALVAAALAWIAQGSNERRHWLRDTRLQAYLEMDGSVRAFREVSKEMVDKIAAQKGPRSWYNRARMESAFTSLMSAGRRVDLVGSERIRERVQEFYASAYEIIDADIESIDAVWRDCHEALFEGAERFMDIARSEVQARTRLISISRTLRRPVRTFKRRRLTKRFRDMTSDVPPTDRSS